GEAAAAAFADADCRSCPRYRGLHDPRHRGARPLSRRAGSAAEAAPARALTVDGIPLSPAVLTRLSWQRRKWFDDTDAGSGHVPMKPNEIRERHIESSAYSISAVALLVAAVDRKKITQSRLAVVEQVDAFDVWASICHDSFHHVNRERTGSRFRNAGAEPGGTAPSELRGRAGSEPRDGVTATGCD